MNTSTAQNEPADLVTQTDDFIVEDDQPSLPPNEELPREADVADALDQRRSADDDQDDDQDDNT